MVAVYGFVVVGLKLVAIGGLVCYGLLVVFFGSICGDYLVLV